MFKKELMEIFSRPLDGDPCQMASNIQTLRNIVYGFDNNLIYAKGRPPSHSGKFIETVNGVDLSCFYADGSNSELYVVFNGAANETHDYYLNPNFPRWTYHTLLDGSFLAFDDPMYSKYPDLKLGWYYGDPGHSFIADCLSVVRNVMTQKGIPDNQATFFSSSGGGYAAIIAASMMPETLSISINPQLNIGNWPAYSKSFMDITGIDLKVPDKLHRNKIIKLIKQSCSHHVIVMNASAVDDIVTQLCPFLDDLGKPHLRYGLNVYDNVLIWLYDAPGAPSAHTSFETRYIFGIIDHIAHKFRTSDKFFIEKYQPLALVVNEAWHDIYNYKSIINGINNLPHDNICFPASYTDSNFELERKFENIHIWPEKKTTIISASGIFCLIQYTKL